MNLLILEQSNLKADMLLSVTGERATHLREIVQVKPGDRLRVGELNGRIGLGFVEGVEGETVFIRVAELSEPLAVEPVDLIVAVPRPQMLKRILQNTATFGVRRLYLTGSLRSQKSYLQSPVLSAEQIKSNLILGLEQGIGTHAPEVSISKNVFEVLKAVGAAPALRLLAHPEAETSLIKLPKRPARGEAVILAVGPEAGWDSSELEAFAKSGFANFGLGHRILRVETAVTAVLAQVQLLREIES